MRHVYLYVHDLRSSGVVRNAIDFAKRLAQDHPTTLVAGYGEGFFAEEAARGPFALKVLAAREGVLGRGAAALRLRAWLSGQPDGVLMSVGNMGHWTPFLACQGLAHIARIYCISNEVARDDGLKSRTRLAWMKVLTLDAARVVVVGRALRRLPLFGEAIASGRAVELPNGVDNALAARLARAPTPHPWLDESVPVVLGIGRLRPQKNFDLLIAAAGRARAARRLRLAIIGGGAAAERERLAGLADAAGLGDDFLLAGETDNVFAWLSRAAVFALPSRWETSSLALLEALAAGTPSVASRLAGDAAMVLDEGRYGLLFNGHDPEDLAHAVLAQIAAPVRPADRALAYDLALTNDAYAGLVADVLRQNSPKPRPDSPMKCAQDPREMRRHPHSTCDDSTTPRNGEMVNAAGRGIEDGQRSSSTGGRCGGGRGDLRGRGAEQQPHAPARPMADHLDRGLDDRQVSPSLQGLSASPSAPHGHDDDVPPKRKAIS